MMKDWSAKGVSLWNAEDVQHVFEGFNDAAHLLIRQMLDRASSRTESDRRQKHTDTPWFSHTTVHVPNVLFVNGPPRSGKTTLLQHLASSLSNAGGVADRSSPRATVLCSRFLAGVELRDQASITWTILRVVADILYWLQNSTCENHTRLQVVFHRLATCLHPPLRSNENGEPSRWFEFELRWNEFADELIGHIARDRGAEAIGIVVDGIDTKSMMDELFSAIHRFRHNRIVFLVSGTFVAPPEAPFPYAMLDVPLLPLHMLIQEDAFHGDTIKNWKTLLQPFDHAHQEIGFSDFLDRSEYGICIGDAVNLLWEKDPQKMLARLLSLAKKPNGVDLFAGLNGWQVRLNSKDAAPSVSSGFGGGGGRMSSNTSNTSITKAGTVRLMCSPEQRRLDELEVLGMAASVVDHRSFEWKKSRFCPLITSATQLNEGHLTLNWPAWVADGSPNGFLRRSYRFRQLQTELLNERQSSSDQWCDQLARLWIMLQAMEFEDSTGYKLMSKSDLPHVFDRILEVADTHSHGHIGLLRLWFLYWLPVLMAPEIGLPDSTCRQTILVIKKGIEKFGVAKRSDDPIKTLILDWMANHQLMISSGRWQSASETNPTKEWLEDEICNAVGPFFERTISLLALDSVVLDQMKDIQARSWHQDWRLTERDTSLVVEIFERRNRGDSLGIESFRRRGVTSAGLRAIWEFIAKKCRLS